ncbi:ParB/RepB/Spo0J family partition protein [Phycisphaeraceae bacterium D3-23]
MASKKKRPSRLGRGLSSLMATSAEMPAVPTQPATGQAETAGPRPATTQGKLSPAQDIPAPSKADAPTGTRPGGQSLEANPDAAGLRFLAIAEIQPNRHQPRQAFSDKALEGLAASLKQDGMMQPIVVRPSQDKDKQGGYELIAGERRWRAAQIAGLETVPAVVHELTDEQSAQWALVENLQREDLNPIEKAEAFKRLSDEFGLAHAQIAERVGLERSTVSNLLRLLALSDFCRDLVREDLLSMGQARAIAGVPDPAAQKALAQQAVRDGLSVRQVEAAARKIMQSTSVNTSSASKAASKHSLADMEKQISQQLGTRVKLKPGRKKGSGTIAIDFYSLDEFDALMARMNVKTS